MGRIRLLVKTNEMGGIYKITLDQPLENSLENIKIIFYTIYLKNNGAS